LALGFPSADVIQGQPKLLGVVLQQGLVRLARRVAELGVDEVIERVFGTILGTPN
jgi:hypothetical protein